MDGNDTELAFLKVVPPCTLYKELFKECGHHNPVIPGKDPSRNQKRAADASNDYTQPTSDKGTAMPNDTAATNSPHIHDNSHDSDPSGRVPKLSLKKRGIQILRTVRHEIESGHQQDEV